MAEKEVKIIKIDIRSPKGMRKKRKRLGHGPGSTLGKTSGRGHKGQKSRSGSKSRRGFEGGQMPLHRRLPKRGFTSIFKKNYYLINLDQLQKNARSNDTLDIKKLIELGFIKIGNSYKRRNRMIKVLGKGDISKSITIYTHKISMSAGDKIIKAGGNVFILSQKVKLNKNVVELADAKIEKLDYKEYKAKKEAEDKLEESRQENDRKRRLEIRLKKVTQASEEGESKKGKKKKKDKAGQKVGEKAEKKPDKEEQKAGEKAEKKPDKEEQKAGEKAEKKPDKEEQKSGDKAEKKPPKGNQRAEEDKK